jgi:integrase/recombinase XerD
MPRYSFQRKDIIRPSEFLSILNQTDSLELKVLLILLYRTGARITELLKLKVEDFVVLEDRIRISIPTEKKKSQSPIEQRRTIEISRNFDYINYLIEYLTFLKEPGTKLFSRSRVNYWYKIKKLKPDLSPHIFRHSRLTLLAEAGASEQELKYFAGWTDTRPSSNYIHLKSLERFLDVN